MKVARRRVADLSEALAWVAELRSRTVLFDVEPLVAAWNSDADELRRGVRAVTVTAAALPRVEAIGFVTNSLRRCDDLGERDGRCRVFYRSGARKPLLVRPYRALPEPGVVVGDQVATDGLLAWRLGFAFAHVLDDGVSPPPGTRLMRLLGRPWTPLLFGP